MFLSKIWKILPVYPLYDCIRSGIDYYKAKKFVGETFYSEAFKTVIKKYLKTDLKKDWLGRLYGVANPNIDSNGKFDVSTMVIEIDGSSTNNNDQVKNWAYKQLYLIANLFKIEKMYSYISLEFKHVGPENFDNYLFIFDITTRAEFYKSLRKLIGNWIVWGGIGLFGYYILNSTLRII